MLAVQRAYGPAKIDPATVGLVEAHGTGIPIGDQTEVAAMRGTFGGDGAVVPTHALGSVKSMIGHCIPARSALPASSRQRWPCITKSFRPRCAKK